MGTRHLTAVYLDNLYQVVQYGQWDGYTSEAGLNCLQFARSIVEENARNNFADKVRKCSWATERYIERKTRNQVWQKTNPEFS